MPQITYGDKTFEMAQGETVLDALSHRGVEIPNSCRAGVCQSCMMRAVKGAPSADSQKGLKPTLAAQGYFMSCVCRPNEDMHIALPGPGVLPTEQAVVVEKTFLTPRVLRLRLRSERSFDYRAGQFINLHHDGVVRSYSLASVPTVDDVLELQIRVYHDGRMTRALADAVDVGSRLAFDGPHGSCFYLPNNLDQNILLVATGCGLALHWGVLRDALRHGHRGQIYLYHGSRDVEGLYLVDELRALAERHSNFHYTPALSTPVDDHGSGIVHGRADNIALEQLPELKGWAVYLCGHPLMVSAVKRRVFLAGAAMKDIYADPFVTAGDRGHRAATGPHIMPPGT